MYAAITENDISEWHDKTGALYHFPNRYKSMLYSGVKVVYYKGKITAPEFKELRKSNSPHYFGIGIVGRVYKDRGSRKNDFFATIDDYVEFPDAVSFKNQGEYLEIIPENRKTNYWRDGVRLISESVYNQILESANITAVVENDKFLRRPDSFESLDEGNPKRKFITYYERDPRLRIQAIEIHGATCQACGFNFKEVYGNYADGVIHVHHIKPLGEVKAKVKVDPEIDLVPLCANCHAVIHCKRHKTLSVKELKAMLLKT